ncbi:MAG: cytochrome c biogenesis protein CcsA [Dehalococcoidales bacterium]|nr:MAG: cytochrome c biogenesis protein CcsA [Dehalococcoidales bacterium]
MNRSHSIKIVLLVLGAASFMAALYMIFFYVPTEQSMGVVQRIFYFHVPVAWIALLSYLVIFVSSIMYLWKRNRKWDAVAISAAEIGFIFTTMFLVTGSIWAKPAWGVWWTWSPRLTSALVLWFIYVAYLTIRSYTQGDDRKARFSSAVAIIGFIDIPIVILSISLWRTQHPSALIFEGGLTSSMLLTLQICILAFTLLYVLILMQSVQINWSLSRVKEMKRLKELNES